MSEQHVPAWKRIKIIKEAQQASGQNNDDDDPFSVTTHLATGSLTKKQKKHIINNLEKDTTKKVTKVKTDKQRKREKVKKEDKVKILKDQIKYLIDYYTTKVDEELPEKVANIEYVKKNLPIQSNDKDDLAVKEVWKFSKQKQNWVLKQFFALEVIPPEFNELLFKYFENLSGNSKLELQKQCQEKISSWNKFKENEKLKMEQIINGTCETESEKDKLTDDKIASSKEDASKSENSIDKKSEELVVAPNKDLIHRAEGMLQIWLDNMIASKTGSDEIEELKQSMILNGFD